LVKQESNHQAQPQHGCGFARLLQPHATQVESPVTARDGHRARSRKTPDVELRLSPQRPIAVNSVYCTNDRTAATILGTATVNGSGMDEFEIDNSGVHALGGGNITIH
jgi:predicted class III extradiol MEMO1 family dioxygenase